MNISILTVFPNLYDAFLKTSLIGRAREKKIVSFNVQSFFSFVPPKERIDAPIIGHGSGMIIKPEVVEKAVDASQAQFGPAFKIFFSPQGKKLDQKGLQELSTTLKDQKHIMLVAGRYEGMDSRVEQEYADLILSVGDFVVMGGDAPAMLFLEGFLRLLPGVVGKQESIEQESFTGPLLDFPVFTHPLRWKDKEVPEILVSGNHGAVDQWRKDQAIKNTVKHHFDWLRSHQIPDEDRGEIKKYIPRHYVALLHDQVLIGDEKKPGTTSVTSIDIHDIARSSKTYGIERFFIVTPLVDQQKIVTTLLNFWQTGVGVEYNPSRHEAVNHVLLASGLQEAINEITKKEGKKPLIIATSARLTDHKNVISFYDQEKVWGLESPLLLIFGTGRGLTPELISQCDYILAPIEGFTSFNHLSVRSAVAIVLDRWLGINTRG